MPQHVIFGKCTRMKGSFVHCWLHALQSEAAFGDDVALHLTAAACDRHDLRVAEAVLRPTSGNRVGGRVLQEQAGPAMSMRSDAARTYDSLA